MDKARWYELDESVKNHIVQVSALNAKIYDAQKEMLTLRCKTVGDIVRGLREAKGISSRKLADTLHLHRSRYVRIEEGDAEIRICDVVALAKFYQVPTDFILRLEDGL